MLRTLLLPWIIVLLSALPVGAAGPLETAGRVDFVSGDAWIIDASQQIRRTVQGQRLRATDTLVTGNDGEVHLDMEDGGYLAIRPNSILKVQAYRARGDKDDRVILNLLKGTFRSFTGWIAKLAPKAYQVSTVTATIGVRGTDHEPLFIPEGSTIGEPGTYDKVNEGATFIEHDSGRIEILPNMVGFAPLSTTAKIRLLERIPDFFRPSPHENLLAGRHKMVQERLQERLDARQRLNKVQPQNGTPQNAPPSEMQEVPTDPNSTPGMQDAPLSSTLPSVPITPAAIAPGVSAAPATAVVPSAGAVPSTVAPAVPAAASAASVPAGVSSAVAPAAAASAVAPAAAGAVPSSILPVVPAASPSGSNAPATSPASAAPSTPAAPRSAVVPGVPEKSRPTTTSAQPSVPEKDRSAVEPPRPEAAAQPAAKDRATIYNERRRRQQEDRKAQYERDREAERAREAGSADTNRIKEQR